MPRLILMLCILSTVSACGRIPIPRLGFLQRDRPAETLPFRTQLLADRRAAPFSVAVEARGTGLDAVRESVRFEGTRHCLRHFGNSDIDWASQPGQPDAWVATSDSRGRLVYSGRCLGR